MSPSVFLRWILIGEIELDLSTVTQLRDRIEQEIDPFQADQLAHEQEPPGAFATMLWRMEREGIRVDSIRDQTDLRARHAVRVRKQL